MSLFTNLTFYERPDVSPTQSSGVTPTVKHIDTLIGLTTIGKQDLPVDVSPESQRKLHLHCIIESLSFTNRLKI